MKFTLNLVLFALPALPAPLHAVEALQDVIPAPSYAAYIYGEPGFAFRPASNIVVNALGYAFGSSTPPSSYVVEMLDATGDLLVSTTLTISNTPAAQFVYTNIPSLHLTAGSTNYLVCFDANLFATNGTKLWTGNLVLEDQPGGGRFDVAPEVEYLGTTTNLTPYEPNTVSNLFVGPNFSFTIASSAQPSKLHISLTASNTALVGWPASDTVGQLQTAPDFNLPMTNVLTAPTVIGTNKVVEVPATNPQALFRLRYP